MIKDKNKVLTRVAYGICCMFSVFWFISIIIFKVYNFSESQSLIITLLLLYGIGLPIFKKMIRVIPNTKIYKKAMDFKLIIILFMLQFMAYAIDVFINIFYNSITESLGRVTELSNSFNIPTPMMIFNLLIISPILEEFIYRKILAEKFLKYGQIFYILSSSFCFAIPHMVSQGISSVVSTLILGLIWSFIYAKTGKILITIILHSGSNFFIVILNQIIGSYSEIYVGFYNIVLLVIGFVGLILFFVYKNKFELTKNIKPKVLSTIKLILKNKGILLLTIVLLIIRILIKAI